MAAVYQRQRAHLFAWALLLAALAAGSGCGGEVPADRRPPELTPRRDPLDALFASASFEPAAGAGGDPLLATRSSGARSGAVWIDSAAGRVVDLFPGAGADSRALAELGGGRALVEVATAAPTRTTDWVLAGPGAARRRLGPPAGEHWRFLGLATEGAAAFLAAQPDAGGPERLLQLASSGELRELAAAPEGLVFGAVAPDGRRAALTRQRDEQGDELHLLDRSAGETTLLLPDGDDGRFRPLAFAVDDERLLLLADDRSDLPRAEWLDLRSRGRQPALDSACGVLGVLLGRRGGPSVFALSCAGRREVALLPAAAGAEVGPALLPSGVRPVAAWPPAGGAPRLYAVAGPRWPRDLWRLDADGDARPLTYGLAPEIDPADLVESEPLALASADGEIAGELWRPRRAGPGGRRAGLLWLEDDRDPPRWFELEPFCQYLAQRGVAVLRLRPRGSDGFGRRFRLAGDGHRRDTESADLELGRRALVERGGADPQRLALLGAGPWNGAVAAAVATRAEAGFALALALDPDPDPLAAVLSAAATASPVRAEAATDPALARRREALRLGAAPARRPLRVVIDPAGAAGLAARAALEARAPGGAPILWFEVAAPPFGAPRIDLRVAALLEEPLRSLLAAP